MDHLSLYQTLVAAVRGGSRRSPKASASREATPPDTRLRVRALAAELPMLRPLGEGRLRWFGLHVYDSSLWVPGEAWSFDRVFALDIRYAMNNSFGFGGNNCSLVFGKVAARMEVWRLAEKRDDEKDDDWKELDQRTPIRGNERPEERDDPLLPKFADARLKRPVHADV